MTVDEEFSEYVAARWARLVRTAVLLGCSQAEAEDVTQSALVTCLVKWRTVREAADRDAYVHRILINTFVSSRRRRSSTERAVASIPDGATPDPSTAYDDSDTMMRALDRLTADQRAAVILRYYAHLDEQQMARVLGVASGTVKSRLSRALRTLSDDPHLETLRGIR